MNNSKRKTNPTKVNLFLDLAIFVAFLLALDPRLTGIAIHEWLGVAGAAAVVVHLLLHWEWIAGVTRRFLGRTSGAARLNYVVDALFIDLIVISLSGMMVSQAILPLLGLAAPGGTFWLVAHSWSADVAVLLVAVHAALHWKWIVNAVRRYVLRPAAAVGKRVEGDIVTTFKRTVIILLAALVVAAGLLALGQTEWAAGLADGVIAANQQSLTAQYDAYVAAGAQPATGGSTIATAGNLARMLVVAAAVIAGSVLLDRRAARQRMARR